MPVSRHRSQRFRRFEALEPRYALAAFLVTNGTDSGPGSLRAALAEAGQVADGPDVITFAPNVKTVTLTTDSLRNSSPVTIAAPNVTIRRSSDANTPKFGLFIVSASLTIEGATLTGGNSPAVGGGAIWAPSLATITLTNVNITGNYGSSGGGLRLQQDASLIISNSAINNNSAAYGGGIVASTFRGISITDTSISGNKADGAAAGSIRGPFTLSGVNVSSNQASGSSGGLDVNVLSNVPGNSIISNSQFRNNSAGSTGGAMRFSGDGILTIENSVFSGNKAASSGGAIFAFGSNVSPPNASLIINYSTFAGNQATDGGAIYAQGRSTLQLNRSNIASNVALQRGGAITSGGVVSIESSSIIRNQTSGKGGGIASIVNTSNTLPDLTIVNSTVSSNQANEGGGIYSENRMMLLSSTIAFNQANAAGGLSLEAPTSSFATPSSQTTRSAPEPPPCPVISAVRSRMPHLR